MRAKKRFGQNFLQDPLIIGDIVALVPNEANLHILEIGPGQGALTSHLHASGCRLQVIEIDRNLAAALKRRGFDVIVGDVMRQDLTSVTSEPTRVVGNLPYNISTPLLFKLFGLDNIVDMHFMLQLEVVERLAAAGKLDDAWLVERGTMPDQRVAKLSEVADDDCPYFAIVLVHGQGRRPEADT